MRKLPLVLIPTGMVLVSGFILTQTNKQVQQLARPSYHAPNLTPVTKAVSTPPTVQNLTPISKDVPVPTSAPAAVYTSEQEPPSYYGEDPARPNYYKVFDTKRAMDEAGIASDDQVYADKLVMGDSINQDWYYNYGGGNDSHIFLFNTTAENLATAGADYATNPITQLRWANSYVQSKYGTWEKAYNHWYTAGRSF